MLVTGETQNKNHLEKWRWMAMILVLQRSSPIARHFSVGDGLECYRREHPTQNHLEKWRWMAMMSVLQRSSPIARQFSRNCWDWCYRLPARPTRPSALFHRPHHHAFLLAMHDAITERIIACAIKVHSVLGPGYVEKVYGRAFRIELAEMGISYEHEKTVPIFYEGQHIASHVLDLVVNGTVIVELKASRSLGAMDYKQIRSYMKAAELHTGLLINFACPRVDIRRVESDKLQPGELAGR